MVLGSPAVLASAVLLSAAALLLLLLSGRVVPAIVCVCVVPSLVMRWWGLMSTRHCNWVHRSLCTQLPRQRSDPTLLSMPETLTGQLQAGGPP